MGRFVFIIREDDGGERSIPFPSERFSIGSGERCDVRIESERVRPRHAEVYFEAGRWFIRSIEGGDSLVVDGMRTLESLIGDGSMVKLGGLELAVCVDASPSSPTPHDSPVPFEREAAASPRVSFRPGEIIDRRYRVMSQLAAGGMGEVYRGEHIELGKPVAIKVMLAELSRDDDFVARFKREAVAASRIGQQNIVAISDFGRTESGRFFFVMELIEGRTLAQHLAAEGAFAPARVVHVGLQTAQALASAHAKGIIHRDLKPENVMLVQQPAHRDFVKLLDFGIAKVTTSGGTATGQTAIGMVVGTPQYMSPEQAAGLGVDARSDIYALGLILYELLAGRPTFAGATPHTLLAMQISAPPRPFDASLACPRPLDRLVFEMLAKRPEQRPQSMEQVVARLEGALPALPHGSETPTPATAPHLTPVSVEPEDRGASARRLGPPRDLARNHEVVGDATNPMEVPTPRPSHEVGFTTLKAPGVDSDAVGATTMRSSPISAEAAPTTFTTAATPMPELPPGGTTLLSPGVGPSGTVTAPAVDAALRPLGGGRRATPAEEAPAELAAIRTNRWPLAIIGLVAAVAIVVGAVLVLNGAGTTPPAASQSAPTAGGSEARTPTPTVPPAAKVDAPAPPPAEPSEKVPLPVAPQNALATVTLDTRPSRAQVYEGSVNLGAAPITLERPKGTVSSLRFVLPGYPSATRTVEFAAQGTVLVDLGKPLPKPTPRKELKDNPYADDLKELPP